MNDLVLLEALFETAPGWVVIILFLLSLAHSLLKGFVGTKAERILEKSVDAVVQELAPRLDKVLSTLESLLKDEK